jgi:signal transduction histidine kinase
LHKPSASYGRTIRAGLAGLAGIVALLALSLSNEYQAADKHAQVEVENITRVLEEHALATINKADLLLRETQRNVRPDDMRLARDASGSRKRELHALLQSQLESLPEASVLFVTNAMGNQIYSSLDPVPHINIADRYHFTRHKDDAAAGLVISPPLVSRATGKWTMVLTRRLNFEDGSFAGVVDAILNPGYFQQFYRSIDLGAHGLVALYDKELHLAARYPPSEKDMGRTANLYAKTYIEKGMKHATYHTKSPVDGVERIYAFRQVGNLPLFVFAGIAVDDYLAEWRRHAWQYGIGLVILGLVVTGLGLRQRRLETELQQLNDSLEQRVNDEVAHRLEQEKLLIQQSRLAAMGEMIGNIAHQWRQPINALTLLLANIKDAFEYHELDKDYLDREVEKGQQMIQGMSSTIDDFRNFFKPNREKQRFLACDAVVEAIKLVSHSFKNNNIEITQDKSAEPCAVTGYPNEFAQVVLNALTNAKDAISGNKIAGKVHIRVEKGTDMAIVSIRDNGGGIPDEILGKVFEPYFTTKGKGTGIGLYMSKMIMDHMGGGITIRNAEDGAEVLLTLPLAVESHD